jgi:uncharacterized protein YjbJ (UPF0337 family)
LKTGALRCPERRRKLGQLFIQRVQEDYVLNQDVFEGKGKEMRGQVKEWWGELTDDDLERAGGKADRLIGLLQQKYGYTRERAEQEFNQRLAEVKENSK